MGERGTYAKGRAKRDEIVDAALDLFSTTGYDRTSFREIARLSGLSQPGLQHYFRNKEELFLEVLRRRDIRNEFRYADTNDEVSLEGLVEIVRHNAEQPGLVGLYVAMSAESTADESDTRQFFRERYSRLLGDIAKDVAKHQDDGRMSSRLDPAAVASLMIAAADGLQLQWLLDPQGLDMGERLQLLTSLILGSDPQDAAGEA